MGRIFERAAVQFPILVGNVQHEQAQLFRDGYMGQTPDRYDVEAIKIFQEAIDVLFRLNDRLTAAVAVAKRDDERRRRP